MTTIMIGYDLVRKDGMDYTKLEDAIKSLGHWWHCLDSTWLLNTNLSESQVMNHLLNYIGKSDRLLILTPSRPSGTWYGFGEECSRYLTSNLG